jgi:hypothetical protein
MRGYCTVSWSACVSWCLVLVIRCVVVIHMHDVMISLASR